MTPPLRLTKTSPRVFHFSAGHIVGTRADEQLPLTFDYAGQKLANGELNKLPKNQRGAVKVIYKPKKDYVGEDSFKFCVNDGEQKSKACTVKINVEDLPPDDSFEQPPDCDDLFVGTTMNTEISFALIGLLTERKSTRI